MSLTLAFLLIAGLVALLRFADAAQYLICYSYDVDSKTNESNHLFGRKLDKLISNIGVMFIIAAVIVLLIEKLS